MVDPLFWLGLSILLVAVSITAVLMAALPAFQELSRAARSAEKLFDTLNRELPPTLEAIRLTSMEITELTDDMTEGVQNVGRMTQQVDEGVSGVRQQAKQAKITTRSVVAGFRAALDTFVRPSSRRNSTVSPRLPASQVQEFEEIQEVDREKLEALDTESGTVALEHHSEQISLHVQQTALPQLDLNQEATASQNRSPQEDALQGEVIQASDRSLARSNGLPHKNSFHRELSQNSSSHASPIHPAGSSLNSSPPSSSSEKAPQPAEAVREQQNL